MRADLERLRFVDGRSVPDQIQLVLNKWKPDSQDCVFKHYFYNKVDEANVPFYHPGPNENHKEWEEALQNKPAPGSMPVLASGFAAVAERLKAQRTAIGRFNQKLHEINGCLDTILSMHDLEWSVRTINARRKHDALRKRTLVLARKVQVLRNRGYALSADEDELRLKLENMEKSVQDPAVNARLEDLWSRLIWLRERAQIMQAEIQKRGLGEEQGLGEEVEVRVKKVSRLRWYQALRRRRLTSVTTDYRGLREATTTSQERVRADQGRLRGVGQGPPEMRGSEWHRQQWGLMGETRAVPPIHARYLTGRSIVYEAKQYQLCWVATGDMGIITSRPSHVEQRHGHV